MKKFQYEKANEAFSFVFRIIRHLGLSDCPSVTLLENYLLVAHRCPRLCCFTCGLYEFGWLERTEWKIVRQVAGKRTVAAYQIIAY
jgi:hypothetical protein